MSRVRLPYPVPYVAVQELVRHFKRWSPELGMHFAFSDITVSNIPKNFEEANISGAKTSYVNVAWDVEDCMDTQIDSRINGQTGYQSAVFLNAYLFDNKDPHLARTQFHADFHRYFFNRPQTPGYNPAIGDQNWTLKTANGNDVVRELYIRTLNTVLTNAKKPYIQVDVELVVYWAALNNDLNFPM